MISDWFLALFQSFFSLWKSCSRKNIV